MFNNAVEHTIAMSAYMDAELRGWFVGTHSAANQSSADWSTNTNKPP